MTNRDRADRLRCKIDELSSVADSETKLSSIEIQKRIMGEKLFNEVYPNNSFVPITIRDLRGKRFGRLLVQHYLGEDRNRQPRWCCLCDCGNTASISGAALLGSRGYAGTKSCGCFMLDRDRTRPNPWNGLPEETKKRWRTNIKNAERRRSFSYSMDSHRAAEYLGTSIEHIEHLVKSDVLRSVKRKGEIWVSSADVAELLAIRLNAKKSCKLTNKMMGLS